MNPIVIDGGQHHCDLHARLVAEVEHAAPERPGMPVPVVVTISSLDEWTRVDDQRDLCDEATDYEEEDSEHLRRTILAMCRPGFPARVRAAVERACAEGRVEFTETLWPYIFDAGSSCQPTLSIVVEPTETETATVSAVVVSMDAMLVVPLVMLIVEELCRANVWATVTLNTNALPVSAAHPTTA